MTRIIDYHEINHHNIPGEWISLFVLFSKFFNLAQLDSF